MSTDREFPDEKKVHFGITPYPDPAGHTAGHAGSETSRDRALREADDATTAARQVSTVTILRHAEERGITVKELREMRGWHHGQASGVLSVLDQAGVLARLTEKRNSCAVYVLAEYVLDRPTSPHGSTAAGRNREIIGKINDLLALNTFPGAMIPAQLLRDIVNGDDGG